MVVVADNDKPGLEHAQEILHSLTPVAASTVVVRAKTGKDAADHLAAGLSVDEFENITDKLDHLIDKTETPPDPPTDLFRRWTTAELLAEPDEFTWLISGLLAEPTYGQIAGEMKTLKTDISGFIQVGLAAGIPIFDRFHPGHARTVLSYVGEGGRIPYTRRLRRIAAAMGVRLQDIPLEFSFDVAPVTSLVFQESLARDLAELGPALVCLDPLYAYHGDKTKASDLHAEGGLLNAVSKPCGDAGASLAIVNHYNQTGSGNGLKRITMAGSGEWADSWILLAHREDPAVDAGQFHLTMQIGSRQWGGTIWDLDLNIGHFDEDTGCHDGDITWDLRRSAGGPSGKPATESPKAAACRLAILEVLADRPWKLTKTEIQERVGGNRTTFAMALASLVDDCRIRHDQVTRDEGGTVKKRPLWGLIDNPGQLGTADVAPPRTTEDR